MDLHKVKSDSASSCQIRPLSIYSNKLRPILLLILCDYCGWVCGGEESCVNHVLLNLHYKLHYKASASTYE